MSDYIQSINGLSSDSASPTDTFIITYKSPMLFTPTINYNVFGHQGDDLSYKVLTDKIFYKVFIDPLSPPVNNPTYPYVLNINACNYEFEFYRNVVKSLLDNNISPHFQRYYHITHGMNYDSYKNIFENKISNEQIVRNLYYIYHKLSNRPSLQTMITYDDLINKQLPEIVYRNLRINILGLMPIDNSNTKKLSDYLRINYPNNTPLSPEKIINLYVIYFQILQACYSLFLANSTHNDLHSGNIWITERPGVYQNLQYRINGKEYNIRTSICVRLYDFDRAYSANLGDNLFINGTLCNKYSSCNRVVKGKDFIKIYCYIRRFINNLSGVSNKDNLYIPLMNNSFQYIFFDDPECHLRNVRNSSGNFITKIEHGRPVIDKNNSGVVAISDDVYNDFDLNYTEFLDQIYDKIYTLDINDIYKFPDRALPDHIFNCSPNLFIDGNYIKKYTNECCK